jgi:gamma-glutamyltranspeptidase/glutathione hydrolase
MLYLPDMTSPERRAAHPARTALAAPHPAAVRAGREVVASGGNAVDAAVAAAMTLTVAYPHMCGVGGDLFALLRRPDGSLVSINASGAHGSASAEIRTPVPVTGPASVTVPGAVSGWARLLELGGSRSAADLLAPAIALAEDGVPVSRGLAAGIERLVAGGTASPQLLRLLGGAGEGDLLRQPALARTLQTMADEGLSSLYDGTVSDRLARGFADHDVPVTRSDLRDHRVVEESAWIIETSSVRVATSPPNSQGYLLLALLGASERLGGLADLEDPAMVAMFARAEACRAAELADPRHVRIDKEQMLAPERLLAEGPPLVSPAATKTPAASGDTVAVTVISGDGTAVSLIQSLFHSFGSQVLETGTGVILHNRGSMFSADPASANHPAPAKRPAHTLMPVVVEHADGRISAHGAMGGRAQPQIHLQLLRFILAGSAPQQAVAAPRLVVRDGVVLTEPGASVEGFDAAGLEAIVLPHRGNEVGHAMVCTVSPDGSLAAGIDPRSDGGTD